MVPGIGTACAFNRPWVLSRGHGWMPVWDQRLAAALGNLVNLMNNPYSYTLKTLMVGENPAWCMDEEGNQSFAAS